MNSLKKKIVKKAPIKPLLVGSDLEVWRDGINDPVISFENNKIPSTCSMRELTNFPFNTYTRNKQAYGKSLVNAVKESLSRIDSTCCLIYNANLNTGNEAILKELGFKKVHSYEGSEGDVTTFMRNCNN